MVPSPTPEHQVISLDLAMAFRAAVADRHRTFQDVDVNILGKIYKPDLVVTRRPVDLLPIPGELVLVAVEIISGNENIERSAKKAAYAAQGIPLYLVVDGKRGARFTEVYRLEGETYELRTTVPADGRMEFAEPFPFALDMRQINS